MLLSGFALVMLAAAAATWRKARRPQPADRDDHLACPPLRLGADVVAGLAVGLLTGLFGVGGGFFIVPTLAVALSLSLRSAIGTSLVIIAATSLLGLTVHLVAGRTIDPGITVAMGAAAVLGAVAGTRLGQHVPQRTLGQAFAGLVVAVAAYLLIAEAFLGGRPCVRRAARASSARDRLRRPAARPCA